MDPRAQELLFRELKDTISQQNKVIEKQAEELKTVLEQRDAQIESLSQELANKQEQIDYLLGKLYGKSSEKRRDVDPNQITMYDLWFNEAEKETDPNAPEPEAEEDIIVKEHHRRRKPKFKEKYANLRTEKVVHELPEDRQFCAKCGSALVKVGERFVRREFIIIPRQVKVIEHYEMTYKCSRCEQENATAYGDLPYFVTAPVPPPLIPHSMASSSIVSTVIAMKFVSGVPFYRQEQLWKQEGLDLSRATMANWAIFCTENYLSVMYEFLRRQLAERRYLMADETTVQVLKEPERPPETKSYMWLYRSGDDGLPPILMYQYQETRRGQNAVDFLDGFEGYLETDGYAGYNKLGERVIRCCCWAHARRKFWDSIPANQRKNPDYSLPAAQGLAYIDKLFDIEKKINERSDFSYKKRYELRLQKEKPVLEAFWSWAEKQLPVKGSKFNTAIGYVLKRKTELMNYLQDGHCSMHNNATEHLAKSFAVGRKNWLFSDTPRGAQASAICYTMVEFAKANSLNPRAYLQFLLEQHLSTEMSDMELSKFMPWNEDVRKALAN